MDRYNVGICLNSDSISCHTILNGKIKDISKYTLSENEIIHKLDDKAFTKCINTYLTNIVKDSRLFFNTSEQICATISVPEYIDENKRELLKNSFDKDLINLKEIIDESIAMIFGYRIEYTEEIIIFLNKNKDRLKISIIENLNVLQRNIDLKIDYVFETNKYEVIQNIRRYIIKTLKALNYDKEYKIILSNEILNDIELKENIEKVFKNVYCGKLDAIYIGTTIIAYESNDEIINIEHQENTILKDTNICIDFEKQLSKHIEENENLKNIITKLESNKLKQEKDIININLKLKSVENEVKNYKNNNEKLLQTSKKLEINETNLEKEIKSYKDRNAILKQENKNIKELLSKKDIDINKKENYIKQLEKKLKELSEKEIPKLSIEQVKDIYGKVYIDIRKELLELTKLETKVIEGKNIKETIKKPYGLVNEINRMEDIETIYIALNELITNLKNIQDLFKQSEENIDLTGYIDKLESLYNKI